jgi:hypothetical protein
VAVNHFRAFVLLSLLALSAAPGCEKTNDIPRLHDEALVMAKGYQQRFDELAHRVETIDPSRLTTSEVQRVYQQAKSTIERYRNDVRQVPTQAEAGVKNGNPDELRKLIDERREQFEGGVIEATSELSAVESWIAMAERLHGARRITPEPPDSEPDTDDSAPAAPGSDAPTR